MQHKRHLLGRWIGLLVGLMLAASPVRAAPATTPADSLRARLATAPPDTNRVLLLDELCWVLSQTDLPTARRYGEQGLVLARRLRFKKGEAKCLNDLGNAATLAADLPAAARYYQQALRAFRAMSHRKGEVYALNGLGNAALQEQAYPRARAAYQQALPLARALADTATLALTLNNLGNVLNLTGDNAAALPIATEALDLYRALGNPLGAATALATLGHVAYEGRRYALGEAQLREAARLHAAAGADFQQTGVLLSLALLYLDSARPAAALATARQALALAQQIGATQQAAFAAEHAGHAAEQLGDFRAGLAYARQYQHLNDSVLNEANRTALTQLQVRFGVQEQRDSLRAFGQEQRLARLAADRQRVRVRWLGTLVGGLALLLGLGALFVWQLRRQRARLLASEAALRQANATKDQIMSIVGHDLRAPMTNFQYVPPLLTEWADAPDPAAQRQLADHLTRQTRQVGALLDNLLAWARTQTDSVAANPQPVRPAVVLASVRDLYAPVAASKGVTLRAEPATDLPELHTDPTLLTAIVRNLTANAIKFTPGGGTVTLTAVVADGGGVVFGVADTGIGMPPTVLAAVQAGNSPSALPSVAGTAGEPGTGLGLAVVARFAALLGAGLAVESAASRGTRWAVVLPPVLPAGASLRVF